MGGSKESLKPIQNLTGSKEDWARNLPPGKVERAELEGSLAVKPLLEEILLES